MTFLSSSCDSAPTLMSHLMPPRCCPTTPGSRSLRQAADLDAPDLRPPFEIGPGELPGMFRLELVIERLGIMIVDENELPAKSQFIDELEDLLVPLHRHEAADIYLVWSGCMRHRFILDCVEERATHSLAASGRNADIASRSGSQ
ncbi:hypothetical protein MPL3365_180222 [Mesorhizobium plurifarium]|uniref:Uncharacterized protein n=1 Tax=Mesorhizobium plurifarium TaxID=69974 RepID=A0A090G6U5_MESPL|nr:hypothetical protein MPL3365_180222 [Mesorhizobium plurifarium]